MKLVFRVHALQRMTLRHITPEEVREVLTNGQTVENYPDDTPYLSRLVLSYVNGRPLHVVAAYNAVDDEAIVVTAYDPDPGLWENDFRRRKP